MEVFFPVPIFSPQDGLDQKAVRLSSVQTMGVAEGFFERPVAYGRQEMVIGRTHFFVAPSTSGAANKWWDINLWKEVEEFSKSLT